jgi:hypothetical protein
LSIDLTIKLGFNYRLAIGRSSGIHIYGIELLLTAILMTVLHSLLLPIVAYGTVDLLGAFGCFSAFFSFPAEPETILVLVFGYLSRLGNYPSDWLCQ